MDTVFISLVTREFVHDRHIGDPARAVTQRAGLRGAGIQRAAGRLGCGEVAAVLRHMVHGGRIGVAARAHRGVRRNDDVIGQNLPIVGMNRRALDDGGVHRVVGAAVVAGRAIAEAGVRGAGIQDLEGGGVPAEEHTVTPVVP